MGHKLDDFIGKLPKVRQGRIATRHRVLKNEIKSLQIPHKAASKVRNEIAAKLNISQSSASKIEKRVGIYLSTLRNCVEAVGGDFDLVVRFPRQKPLHLHGLDEIILTEGNTPHKVGAPRRKRA